VIQKKDKNSTSWNNGIGRTEQFERKWGKNICIWRERQNEKRGGLDNGQAIHREEEKPIEQRKG